MILRFGVLLLVSGMLMGCTGRDQERLATSGETFIQLALNWFPEVEHGGYFAAQVHGDYAAEGLRVEILPGGPGSPVIPRVATGNLVFGVDNADVLLLARSQGAAVRAVMAPIQQSPRIIMVHEESGIEQFEDLRDCTLAITPNGTFAHFLRRRVALPGVKIVPYSGSVAQFLLDQRYAQQGYVFSEPFVARQQGAHPRCLYLSHIGFNPYTSILVVRDETIREQPDVVHRFVQAAVRGWSRYLESPDETHDIIRKQNPEMGPEILQYGVESLRPLVLDATAQTHGIGCMSEQRWQTLLTQLEELGLIQPGTVRAEDAFTEQFVAR